MYMYIRVCFAVYCVCVCLQMNTLQKLVGLSVSLEESEVVLEPLLRDRTEVCNILKSFAVGTVQVLGELWTL